VIVANETIDKVGRRKEKCMEKCIILKVNFENAYDSVK